MLSVYHKMKLAVQVTPSWKARWARRLSQCQNPIIMTYFIVYSVLDWIVYFFFEQKIPEHDLNKTQKVVFASLTVPKFIYEISVVIIFAALFKSFNALSQDYQIEQKGNKGSGFVCCAKVLAIFISTLYLINTVFYDIVNPALAVMDAETTAHDSTYRRVLLHVNLVIQFADFLSCMCILFLIHSFGPYRQYLRRADLISTKSYGTRTDSSKPSMRQQINNMKRISGITDL